MNLPQLAALRRIQNINITVLAFGLSGLWASLAVIILPTLVLDFVSADQKNSYLAIISIAGLIIALVMSPVAGALSDRLSFFGWRRRPYIIIGVVGTLAFLPGIALAGSIWWLLAVLCAIQVCSNLALGAFNSFIPAFVPHEDRGAVSGLKTVLDGAGAALMVVVVGFLLDGYVPPAGKGYLWGAVSLIGGGLLFTGLWTVVGVRQDRADVVPARAQPRQASVAPGDEEEDRAHPDFPWFLLSRFIVITATSALQTFALFFLQDVVKVSDPSRAISVLAVSAGTGALVVTLASGILSDRIGRRPLILSSGFVGVVGVLLLLTIHDMRGVIVVGTVLGLSSGLFLSANWALASDLASKRATGLQMGLVNVATAGAGLLARAAGFLIDALNKNGGAQGYKTVIILSALLLFIGTLLILLVRPERKRKASGAVVPVAPTD